MNEQKMMYHIADFLKVYLPNVRHRDTDTVESYRYSLNLYILFLTETQGILLKTLEGCHFSQSNLVAFTQWLQEKRKNVATTVNHRLSDVRGFCKYLHKKKVISDIEYALISDIHELKDDRVIDFTWLSHDDVKLVLQQPDVSKKIGIRDHFMLSLFYESGARIDEILSTRIRDLHLTANNEIDYHIMGKGMKPRVTPLSGHIAEELSSYISVFHTTKDPDNLLFYSMRKGQIQKLSEDCPQKRMELYENSAKNVQSELLHLHPHLFRRTRAMHLYQAGVPLPTISEWLGHSSIETTRFYAQVTAEMKREALKKLGEGNTAVLDNDIQFKYADDEETLKKLCGLK